MRHENSFAKYYIFFNMVHGFCKQAFAEVEEQLATRRRLNCQSRP